jgi:hypothetical protein
MAREWFIAQQAQAVYASLCFSVASTNGELPFDKIRMQIASYYYFFWHFNTMQSLPS